MEETDGIIRFRICRNQEVMLRRLIEVFDSEWTRERLYPRFVEYVGQMVDVAHIEIALALIIHDALEGKNSRLQATLGRFRLRWIRVMISEEEDCEAVLDLVRQDGSTG